MSGADSGVSQVVLIILAILLPPLAVFLAEGANGDQCGIHFWLNILLCCFFWIPGILHAIWVILK